MENCFIPDNDYAAFLERQAAGRVPGPGRFVWKDGQDLGKHLGITHYTIGQRKGLGIALGHPVYVKEIRAGSNEVVLSDEPALFSNIVKVRDVNFLSIPDMAPGEQLRARAKVRYHHAASPAVLEMQEDGCVRITFDDPVRAAAPGQSSVFYDGNDCVIGGGIIM
jgi:tRNA-specific 2-thiouridylase